MAIANSCALSGPALTDEEIALREQRSPALEAAHNIGGALRALMGHQDARRDIEAGRDTHLRCHTGNGFGRGYGVTVLLPARDVVNEHMRIEAEAKAAIRAYLDTIAQYIGE